MEQILESRNYTQRPPSSNSGPYGLSDVEAAILRSKVPIELHETQEITVNGHKGIWANRAEVNNWKGLLPLSEYKINEDLSPEIITKKTEQSLEYIQELAIRYLRPPTPPAPGEIVISQEPSRVIPPAPPLIVRQQPPRPETPEPLVIREAPPKPPPALGRKVIQISGKRLPPPPRKVIIERLAPLPSKPQSVIVERWLPYSQVKRRVIFQKANQQEVVHVKPKNIIVQWEAPRVEVKKDYKYLGVIRANPVEYVQRYGAYLKQAKDLPEFVLNIKTPEGIVLAADQKSVSPPELIGNVQALALVDLDKEGLSEYKGFLNKLGISYTDTNRISDSAVPPLETVRHSVKLNTRPPACDSVISEIFSQIDMDCNGKISIEEAERLLLRLNSRLNRGYGEDEVQEFFKVLDVNKDNFIDLEEFKAAFKRLIS